MIACSGLTLDRVARLLGIDPGVRILPFRGEYFVLLPKLNTVVHSMIYPVRDPARPFLGVHLSPMITGTITAGSNAVLSPAREKYSRFSADPRHAASALPKAFRLSLMHQVKGGTRATIERSTAFRENL
ncbi:hypothetical protein [Roseovarius sp. MMSF_3281]|uniref:hypothetical protein n=1 Tax=Roseovarius sp. MMSF_3281 TaxID=3046694 RepID=UPI0035321DFE